MLKSQEYFTYFLSIFETKDTNVYMHPLYATARSESLTELWVVVLVALIRLLTIKQLSCLHYLHL